MKKIKQHDPAGRRALCLQLLSQRPRAGILLSSAARACLRPRRRCASAPIRTTALLEPSSKQGFENQLAEMIAQRSRHEGVLLLVSAARAISFEDSQCRGLRCGDGCSRRDEAASTTLPYYRSSYVFVSRRDRDLHIRSFDDPRLRQLRIGVHVLGDRTKLAPSTMRSSAAGIVRNLVGYSIFGNLAETNPPQILLSRGERHIDVAIAWGPLAGYFARHSAVPLESRYRPLTRRSLSADGVRHCHRRSYSGLRS